MRIPILLGVLLASAGLSVGAADEAALFEELVQTREPGKALALAQRGEAAVPFLAQGLEKGGKLATLCAWALWQHPQPGAAPALRERLLKVDQVAGYYAARALGKLPSPGNVAALSALLSKDTNGYWELSSGGVGRLRDAWNESGQRYSQPAPTNMPNLRVAYAAMEALGELGGDEAVTTLLRALDSDQHLIRYGAARGLGRAFGVRQSSGAFGGATNSRGAPGRAKESARGLAHSKTLAHKRRFKVSKREISVGGILAPPLSRWVRKAGVRENVLDQARRSRQPDGSLQRRHSFHVSGCPVRPANCSAPRRQPAEPAVSSHAS